MLSFEGSYRIKCNKTHAVHEKHNEILSSMELISSLKSKRQSKSEIISYKLWIQMFIIVLTKAYLILPFQFFKLNVNKNGVHTLKIETIRYA